MNMKSTAATAKPVWILVANGSRARVLARADDAAPLTPVHMLSHPESRARDADLTVAGLGHGRGAATYAPRLDPKDKEHQQFAQQVADALNAGVAAHACSGLLLAASNPFLGEVKQRLSAQAAKLVRGTAPADLTSFEGRELQRRIDEALGLNQ
jgi:protein required for attachment to host cells